MSILIISYIHERVIFFVKDIKYSINFLKQLLSTTSDNWFIENSVQKRWQCGGRKLYVKTPTIKNKIAADRESKASGCSTPKSARSFDCY
jgi:hypothetical protein